MPSLQEIFDGVIIRVESYFEHDDTTNRIMIDFIDGEKRIQLKGSTDELEMLIDFLGEEFEKANKRKYIH